MSLRTYLGSLFHAHPVLVKEQHIMFKDIIKYALFATIIGLLIYGFFQLVIKTADNGFKPSVIVVKTFDKVLTTIVKIVSNIAPKAFTKGYYKKTSLKKSYREVIQSIKDAQKTAQNK